MKTIKYFVQLMLVALVALGTTSCARDYDEPNIDQFKPHYEPDPSYTLISVKDFKEMYAHVANGASEAITQSLMIEAVVTGNDISGNIFKQVYIQDQMSSVVNTRGLYMGVDQNNVNNIYSVGQKVYIDLKDLYAVKYGDQLQIGDGTTQANRISWTRFQAQVHRHDWSNPKLATPRVVDMGAMTPEMANTLVTFENVEFVNAGTGKYIEAGNQYTEQAFTDAAGNRVVIRTSEYFTALKGEPLPTGKVNITGILGRHFDNWQVVLRDKGDIAKGEGGGTVTPPEDAPVFFEKFGVPVKEGTVWPLVAVYTGWDMKAPIVYTGIGKTDVRMLSTEAHLWFPKGDATGFTISGINTTGKTDLNLTFSLAAGVYNTGESTNLNLVLLKINGAPVAIPSTIAEVDAAGNGKNKFYPITINNFPIGSNVSIEFSVPTANNIWGFRLDNVKIAKGDGSIIVTP